MKSSTGNVIPFPKTQKKKVKERTRSDVDCGRYVSEFKDAKFHGCGTFINGDVQRIVGEWHDDYPWSAKEDDGDQAFFGTYAKGERVLR